MMSAKMLRLLSLVPAFLCAVAFADTPVVVELFTSEGCSSCPAADQLLARLEREQPVQGAHIIALSEHVDYWDRLGWRDPFSSAQFTSRQQEYSRVLHEDGPYTPEMVIDGTTSFVGNQSSDAFKSISQAARDAKVTVRIASANGKIEIQADATTRAADVIVAITERKLMSDVSRGENAGRKLQHTAVVRWMRVEGKTRPRQPFSGELHVSPEKGWKAEDLRIVVFLQERASRKVLGAAESSLSAP
jgi:hypothetical protein